MATKVLVTGATGFVGYHLCQQLIAENFEVWALARNREKFDELNLTCRLVTGDLAQSFDWIEKLPVDLNAVIHVAGLVHTFHSGDYFRINAEATKTLIDQLKNKFSKLKFILISSLAAAGPSPDLVTRNEKLPPSPVSEYGKSKLLAEEVLKKSPSSWETAIIRPPIVIGPMDPGLLEVFQQVAKGWKIFVGKQRVCSSYSFVGVFDLVSVIMKVLKKDLTELKPDKCPIFFAAHPQIKNYSEIIETMAHKLQVKKFHTLWISSEIVKFAAVMLKMINEIYPIKFKLTPDKATEIAAGNWICDSQKSMKILDMNYEWSLEKIIDVTVDDYKKRGLL